MSNIYHQVFVNSSYDTADKIELLKRHMYVKAKPVIYIETPQQKPTEIIVEKHTRNTIYYPDMKDTLFWCLYIAKNGVHEYEMINQGYSNIEIAEKQKVMAFVKEQPSKLKNTNVKVTNIAIQEIMSDIITNAKLNISTLIAMSLFYKRRIILTKNDKLYISICPIDEYEQTLILHKNNKGDYGIETDVTEDKIKQIESEQYCLHRHDKPLDAISKFSSDELKKLSVRFGVDQMKKYKKTELYHETTLRCLW
jgi:hypothetical protein